MYECVTIKAEGFASASKCFLPASKEQSSNFVTSKDNDLIEKTKLPTSNLTS